MKHNSLRSASLAALCAALSALTLAPKLAAQRDAYAIPPLSIGDPSWAFGRDTYHQLPAALSVTQKLSTGAAAKLSGETVLSAAPTQLYSHGDPTGEEQYILELINRARANPTAEGKRIAETTDPATNSALDYFTVDRNKLKSDYAGYPVRPPLAFNSKLIAAARLHSQDMSTNNFQDHTGSNGSTLQQRIAAQNYVNWIGLGENIFAYAENLFMAHAAFQVDWGNTDLGHRQNDMNFDDGKPIYNEIGVGVVHDDRPSPHVGPIVVTEDFGASQIGILTGVVYRDLNNNSFYDAGEGIAGVTIMPSGGTYYAVTSTSGGYAIPITNKGTMTITASGGGLGKTIVKNATLGTESVKVDFTTAESSAPGAVQLSLPVTGSMITSTSVALRWNKIIGTTFYYYQVATDSLFANIVAADSTVTDSIATFSGALNDHVYYWRVRARNEVGWGPYGSTWIFRVLLLPSQVSLLAPVSFATIATNNVPFSWHRASPSDDRYWLEVSTDAAFATVALRDTAVSDTFRIVNGLNAGATYYWRTKAHNGAGWGPFSAVWNAVTGSSGVERTAAIAGFSLAEAVPNPIADATRIAFDLQHDATVRLEVIDDAGRAVATLASGPLDAGHHEAVWDARGVAAGIYMARLSAGGIARSVKLVVTH